MIRFIHRKRKDIMVIKNNANNLLLPILSVIILLITSCSNDKKVYLEQLENRWQILQTQEAEYGIEKQSIIDYQDFLKDFPEAHKYGNPHISEAKKYIEKIKVIQDSIRNYEIEQLKNDSLKQMRYDFYSAAIENDYIDYDCISSDEDEDNDDLIQINEHSLSEYYCYLMGISDQFPNLFACAKSFAIKKHISIENNDKHSALEAIAGVPVFSHDPKDTNYEFSYINPAIINWAHKTLLPMPENRFYNYSYQQIYNKIFRSIMRKHALAYYYLHNITDVQDITKIFNEELAKKDSYAPQEFVYKQFSEFNIKSSMIYQNTEDDWNIGLEDLIGFWIRRTVDGSADELWKGLGKVLSLYDNEWKESMLCNPQRYLKQIDWIPENVIANSKSRSFTIKKDSLYMICNGKHLWNKPELLSRRTNSVWYNEIIHVDSLGKVFTHNGEKFQWIKIDKNIDGLNDSTISGWIIDAYIDRQIFNCNEVKNCSLIVEIDSASTENKKKVHIKLLNPTEFPIAIQHPNFFFSFSFKDKKRTEGLYYSKSIKQFPAKKETLLATITIQKRDKFSNKYEYLLYDSNANNKRTFKVPADESWSLKGAIAKFKVNNVYYEIKDTTLSLWE